MRPAPGVGRSGPPTARIRYPKRHDHANDGAAGPTLNDLRFTVNNVAPSIAIGGAASVAEGSAYSLSLGAVTDPGTDTVSSYIVHWGDGGTDTYATNAGAKTHTYADGLNSYSITVDLVDEDGTHLTVPTRTSVTVTDAAPSISVVKTAGTALDGATFHVDEPGATVTYTVTIENTSVSSDPVTVTSFLDSVEGDPGTTPADLACEDEDGDPFLLFTTAIASGDTVTCTFTGGVSGNAGDGRSDDGDRHRGRRRRRCQRGHRRRRRHGRARRRPAPSHQPDQGGHPDQPDEPGGTFSFEVTVTNGSVSSDPVTITSLSDDIYGDLDGQGDCAVGAEAHRGRELRLHLHRWLHRQRRRQPDRHGHRHRRRRRAQRGHRHRLRHRHPRRRGAGHQPDQAVGTARASLVDEPGGTVSLRPSPSPTTRSAVTRSPSPACEATGTSTATSTARATATVGACSRRLLGGARLHLHRLGFTGNAGDSQTDTVTATATTTSVNEATATGSATVTLDDVAPSISVTRPLSRPAATSPAAASASTVPSPTTPGGRRSSSSAPA